MEQKEKGNIYLKALRETNLTVSHGVSHFAVLLYLPTKKRENTA